MKLPKEYLMGERYYQAHAAKLVENHRNSLELSLNSTTQEKAVWDIGLCVSFVVALAFFVYVSFFTAVIALISGLFLTMIVKIFFTQHHPESYGKWQVKCKQVRFPRGGNVIFTCERIVDGQVVERVQMH